MQPSSLDDIIALYLESIESGAPPDRERWMADYPEQADGLRDFFADLDRLSNAVHEGTSDTEDAVWTIDPARVSLSTGNRERLLEIVKRKRQPIFPSPVQRPNWDQPSATIGPYKLLQRIGEGGMGEVWMAEQEKPIRRRVALKLIKTNLDNKQIVARFEAERQALAMMNHQNIAKVLDAGSTESGEPYFVMELVNGIAFHKYCDTNRLSIDDRLKLLIPVCQAVQHAHQKGIIHRDLKPSNILITLYDGKPVPKVIDFGLAKALQHQSKLTDRTLFTEFGQVVGTLQYMSPEQAEMNALDVDTRTDVYSLGVMLYELLTGSTPIDQETLERQAIYKILESIREKDPPRPSVRLSSTGDAVTGISQQRQIEPQKLGQILRGELDWITMKALEKDRTRRYETASALASDIERFLSGDLIEARPPSKAYAIRKFVRKNRRLAYSTLAVGSLLVLAIVVSTFFAISESIARKQAFQQTQNAIVQRNIADQERTAAVRAAQRAAEAEKLAENEAARANMAADLANAAKKDTEATLARSNFLLANFRFDEGRVHEAHALLDGISKEHRNIEWTLAKRKLDGSYATLYRPGFQSINSVCINPYGSTLAAGVGNDIVIWDAVTGIERLTINGHQDDVNQVCFSPHGSFIASASSDHSIKMWDYITGKEILTLSGHSDDVICIGFNSTGTKLVSGSQDRRIKIWDIKSRKELISLTGHSSSVKYVSFNADDSRIVSSDGNTTRLWCAETALQLKSHKNTKCVAFSPVASQYAIVESKNPFEGHVVRLCDSTTGKEAGSFDIGILNETVFGVDRIVFSPDGANLAISNAKTIEHWNIASQRKFYSCKGHRYAVTDMCYSPDGSRMYSSEHFGRLKLWDLANRPDVRHSIQKHSNFHVAKFSPNGHFFAAAHDDGSIVIFETMRERQLFIQGHSAPISCIEFSSDSTVLATGSDDGKVKLWDVETGVPTQSLAGDADNIECISFSSDGSRLAIGNSSGEVHLWSPGTDAGVRQICKQDGSVYTVFFGPSGRSLVINGDSAALIWDIDNEVQIAKLEGTDGDINPICCSPDGKRIAGVVWDDVRIWDATSGKMLGAANLSTGQRADAIRFTSDGSRLILADNHVAKIFDAKDLVEVFNVESPDGVNSFYVGPDGMSFGKLATHYGSFGADNAYLELFSKQYSPNSYIIPSPSTLDFDNPALSPDGSRLAFVDKELAIHIWDTLNQSEVSVIRTPPYDACDGISHDNQRLYVSVRYGNESDAAILDIASGKILESGVEARTEANAADFYLFPAENANRWIRVANQNDDIELVDTFSSKSEIVQSFRIRMAKQDSVYHADKAFSLFEHDFGTAFHHAWQSISLGGNALAELNLRSTADELPDGHTLPKVAEKILSRPISLSIRSEDLDYVAFFLGSKPDELAFYNLVSEDEFIALLQACQKACTTDFNERIWEARLARKEFHDAFDALLKHHQSLGLLDTPVGQYNFRQKVSQWIALVINYTEGSVKQEMIYEAMSGLVRNELSKPIIKIIPPQQLAVIQEMSQAGLRQRHSDSQTIRTWGEQRCREISIIERLSLVDLLKMACEQHPSHQIHFTFCEVLFVHRDFNAAIENLKTAYDIIDPKSPPGEQFEDRLKNRALLILSLCKTDRIDEAKQRLNERNVIKANPPHQENLGYFIQLSQKNLYDKEVEAAVSTYQLSAISEQSAQTVEATEK